MAVDAQIQEELQPREQHQHEVDPIPLPTFRHEEVRPVHKYLRNAFASVEYRQHPLDDLHLQWNLVRILVVQCPLHAVAGGDDHEDPVEGNDHRCQSGELAAVHDAGEATCSFRLLLRSRDRVRCHGQSLSDTSLQSLRRDGEDFLDALLHRCLLVHHHVDAVQPESLKLGEFPLKDSSALPVFAVDAGWVDRPVGFSRRAAWAERSGLGILRSAMLRLLGRVREKEGGQVALVAETAGPVGPGAALLLVRPAEKVGESRSFSAGG
mmetsp:Transcript_51840/g.150809  ORF Transcript_51840/g.150809 Transcript_51840/m.150809 type:complete len:266 (-) Transcript_51840:322-1119(-)